MAKLARILSLTGFTTAALTFASANHAFGDWPPAGVTLCTAGVCHARGVRLAPDGQGGAFIAWQDSRAPEDDIYIQRVLASGDIAPGWPAAGLPVCTNPAPQFLTASAPDGFGGVVVAWIDDRVPASDIYAQRILADGTIAPGWPVDGAPVTRASGTQDSPTVAPDGLGGAYFAWDDRTVRDIYAQHLSTPT